MLLSAIVQASVTGLSRLILIMLVAYAVYSLFIRFIIPGILRKQVNRFRQQFFDQNPEAREAMDKKEGEVSIKYVKKEKESPTEDHDDEYIDFEEIDKN